MEKKYKFVILANERAEDHNHWIQACEKYAERNHYRVVDLTSNNWLEEIQKESFDYLLAKPGGLTMPWKQLYDERLMILGNTLNYKIYPSLNEVLIYENKRYFSYWLKANNIPHPSTHVFYKKEEAEEYINKVSFPVVAKLNIGASGNGVQILKNKRDALIYIREIFSKGKTSRVGPRLDKRYLLRRAVDKILNPKRLFERLMVYKSIAGDVQKGHCLFQGFIEHEYEWRVVRIGKSFFAHKKLKQGEKTSGSLLKGYENPPLTLFTFVKDITDRHNLSSMAVDIFEISSGKYLINEMQCIFGQSDPYQMLVDGTPGRYRNINGEWMFDKGDFATNACYNLRLDYLMQLMSTAKNKRQNL